MDLEPLPVPMLLGNGLALALVLLSYLSGLRVRGLRRHDRLEFGPGRPMPPALQWHAVAGLFAGANAAVVAFAALGSPFGSAAHGAGLLAAAAAVFTGAGRLFFGAGGRWHLLAAAAALPAFALWLAGLLAALGGASGS